MPKDLATAVMEYEFVECCAARLEYFLNRLMIAECEMGRDIDVLHLLRLSSHHLWTETGRWSRTTG